MDWKRKLSSRKLWVAVAALVSGMMLALGQSEDRAKLVSGVILQLASVLGYLFAEGLTDVADLEYRGKHEE